jgi:hypothetical protein
MQSKKPIRAANSTCPAAQTDITIKESRAGMVETVEQIKSLRVASATTELVTRILALFPQARIVSREVPWSDEEISLEVYLPGTLEELDEAQDKVIDCFVELQDKYGLLIHVSVLPG